MASNEFVFLICQDKKSGRVVTVYDNRDRLEAEKSGTSPESLAAIKELYGGK